MRILVISHDAGRAGAQLLLLGFLQWLKQHKPDVSFDILLNGKGDLVPDFEQVGKVYSWVKPKTSRDTWYSSWRKKQLRNQLRRTLKEANYQLVYANTFMNGEILASLELGAVPIVTHVHELAFWIEKGGEQNKHDVLQHSNFFIAASQAVKSNLMSYGVKEEKLQVIYEYTNSAISSEVSSYSLKEKLNLSKNALIVGSCGAESFRKGKDLFIPIAEQVLMEANESRVHFVWIGGRVDDEIQDAWDASKFKNQIHFINHLPNASNYFHEFDVFLMLSRNDPFPVVNLEAGARAVPVICFDESGGTPELLTHDPSSIIPFLQIEPMAKRCTYLLQHKEERKALGLALQQKVRTLYDTQAICNELYESIQRIAQVL